MSQDVIAESSSAPVSEVLPIEQWDSSQRTEWLKTGNIPEPPKTIADPAPATTESSEASPAEAQEKDETRPESETDKPKESAEHKVSPAEKRIKQLLARNRELEERLNAQSKPPVEDKKSESTPAATPATGEPKPEDFDTYDKYVRALARFELKQERELERQAEAQRKQQDREQEISKSWDAKKAKALQSHPDFDEVLATADVPISREMHEAILTADAGAELAYHLATHLDEAKRIAALSPVAQVRELGKLEAQLSAPPPVKKTTSASKPPTELPARATAAGDEADDALKAGDFGRYKRIMNTRETKRAA